MGDTDCGAAMTRAEWDAEFYKRWNSLVYGTGMPATQAQKRALELMEVVYGPRPAAEPKPPKPQDEPGAPASGSRASWILRLGAKVTGSLLRIKMKDKLNRWLPIIGVVIVAISAGLKAFGLTWAASILDTIGGAIGATSGVAPDTIAAITTGAASLFALYGVVRKLIAVFKPKP